MKYKGFKIPLKINNYKTVEERMNYLCDISVCEGIMCEECLFCSAWGKNREAFVEWEEENE